MVNIYEQAEKNKLRSLIIIGLFLAFVAVIGFVFWKIIGFGPDALAVALVIGGSMSFAGYWFSDKIILSISQARPASKKQNFDFFTVAENISMAARIPMPRLYVIQDSAPNAFATGRDPQNAIICATTGLLGKLNRTELEAVVAHEMSHIGNYDIRLMGVVTILVGAVTLLGDFFIRGRLFGRGNKDSEDSGVKAILYMVGIILALLSPLIARLMQLAISRRREFLADASGVMITKYPNGLISALKKISSDKEPLEAANKATAHLYIINPLKNHHDGVGWFASLFNTHPPLEERIKALEKLVK